MAITERLALLVTANVNDAVRGLQRVEHEADRSLGRAEQRIDRVGAAFTRTGAVMLTAGGLAAAALWRAGGAASDLNETVNQSEQIFGSAADEIAGFAEGAVAIGQSERAAREAANTFGLFFTNAGKSNDEAADMSITMTRLASDMASFKNTTPEEAVEALGAALRGESEPIRRYSVMLDDATLKQRALSMGLIETTTGTLPPAIRMQAAYAEILEQTSTIQDDFARTAEDPANAMRVTRAEVENMTASIGEAMLPVMKDGIGVVNGLVGGFNNLPGPVQSTISKVAVATTGFLLVGGAGASAVGQLIKMRDTFTDLNTRLAGASRATRLMTGALAGLAAVGAAYALWEISRAANAVSINVEEAARATTGELLEAFEQWHDFTPDRALEGFEQLARGSEQAARDLRDAWVAAGHDGAAFDAILADVAEGNEIAAERAGRNTDATLDLNEATGAASTEAAEYAQALEDAEKAQRELTEAMNETIDFMLGGIEASIAWEAALDELTEGVNDHGRSLDIGTEAGRRNHAALRNLVEAGNQRLQSMRDQGASERELRDAQALMVLQLEETADQLGINRDQAGWYSLTLGSIPTSINTTVRADVDAAIANIQKYINKLNEGAQYRGPGGGPAFRAAGGPVSARMPYIVGEKGPELFVPSQSGTIVPNHSLTSGRSGGGGGTTINLTVNALDPRSAKDAVVEALQQWNKSNGPVPVRVA